MLNLVKLELILHICLINVHHSKVQYYIQIKRQLEKSCIIFNLVTDIILNFPTIHNIKYRDAYGYNKEKVSHMLYRRYKISPNFYAKYLILKLYTLFTYFNFQKFYTHCFLLQ